MRDPVEFATLTTGEKLQVVCLTATPDDGIHDGCERNLMNLMDYRLIRTGEKQDLEVPKVDAYFEVNSPDDVMNQVFFWMDSRAVLIYANGDLHDTLAKDYLVTRVTPDTPAADLRSMDEKKNGNYPIYLISEEYGIRGLDYRAAKNPHGICMIICSEFSDSRTRLQALKRIRRYTDAGNYVKNSKVPDIDQTKFVELKGRIAEAEKKVQLLMSKYKKPKNQVKSQT